MATVEQEFQEAFTRHQAGDWGRAEAAYRRLIRRAPREADVRYLLGTLYSQQQDYARALPLLEQAVALDPAQARYYNNLGVALKELGHLDAAVAANSRSLELQPRYAEAMNNRGILARERRALEEAIHWYEQSIVANPGDPQAHNNLGIAIQEHVLQNLEVDEFNYEDYGKLDKAEQCFREAIRWNPQFAAAHNNLGAVLRLQRRYEEALVSVERALALEPDSEQAQVNWALLLYLLGFYDRAEAQLLRNLSGREESKGTLCGLADCCRMQGRYEESLAYFDRFLAAEPDDVEARYARGQVLLQLGRMDEGWDGYEWRLRRPNSPQKIYTQPSWNGEPLAGRTLLVHAEQGFGDAFQFVRYLPLIEKDGGRVIFECQPGTRDLLARGDGFDQIVERPGSNRTDGQVPHDLQIPLMSLARLFPHPAEEPPGREPYIHPDPNRVADWTRRLTELAAPHGSAASSLKVGMIWAGNPKHGNDRNRSARLADLAPLSAIPGVTLFSLQKGPSEAEAQDPPAGITLVDLAPSMESFSDTAAILANLNLLISVDTSTAHLAGAMGVPTWLLTPFAPEWRWRHDRNDTPWYPAMRLFRQPAPRDWASVIRRAADELERLALPPLVAQIEAAERCAEAGDTARARAALQALAKTTAPHPRALNDLGVLYWQEGAAAEALAAFQRALEIAPQDQATRLNCAVVLRAFGHADEAARIAAS